MDDDQLLASQRAGSKGCEEDGRLRYVTDGRELMVNGAFRHFKAAKLGLSLVECCLTDTVTASNIRHHRTRLLFLYNPNDLLIAEPAAFDFSVSLRNSLSSGNIKQSQLFAHAARP